MTRRGSGISLIVGGSAIDLSCDDGPDVLSKDKVRGYVGVVRFHSISEADKTFVEWSSSWEDSDGGVAKFCSPTYGALLNALRNQFSSGA